MYVHFYERDFEEAASDAACVIAKHAHSTASF